MFDVSDVTGQSLSTESIEGASLPLECVDHIHGGDGLPLGMFSVGDSVPDHILQEHLENSSGLLVDEARDTLDSSPPRQTADCRLGDSLDVIPENLAMAFGTTLAQSFSSFSSSSHFDCVSETDAGCPVHHPPFQSEGQ